MGVRRGGGGRGGGEGGGMAWVGRVGGEGRPWAVRGCLQRMQNADWAALHLSSEWQLEDC